MVAGKKHKVKSPKLGIKKGDLVVAISGEDAAKGKPGKVLQVYPKTQKVLVEGYNYARKHMRKTQDNPHGGIVDMEVPIHISNLKLHQSDDEKSAGKPAAEKKKAR